MALSIVPKRQRQHADWIASYLGALVQRSEAPERFHFWIAASIIAGALRRRVFIEMEAFRWYPNMFVVLIGPPGTVKKSTTINIGTRLLRQVPNIHFSSDIITWEAFVEQLARAEDIFAEGNPPTTRFNFDHKHKKTCAMTSVLSEWGTFLDPDNHLMINMLTEFYDGKDDIPIRKTTKTQGEDIINNPFVNMIAGTTPDWMADNFKSKFGGWGFSSRCIFLHCAAPERFIAYPDEEWRGQFRTAMSGLRDDLVQISTLQGEMTLTPEARAYGRQWYEQHMRRKTELDRHPNHDPWLSYYLARKFDHAHKLAICLSASRASDLRITLDDLMAACQRCDEVELELTSIFGTGDRTQSRSAKLNTDVWNALESMMTKSNGGIPERAAYQFTLRYMSYGETKQFLDHLTAGGILGREVESGTTWIVFGPEWHKQKASRSEAT